jgi:hypothetical protein
MLLRRDDQVVVAIWIKNDAHTMLNGEVTGMAQNVYPADYPKRLTSIFAIHNVQGVLAALSEPPPERFFPAY